MVMEPPQNIRLLKAIVIGLGVLIFVGLAVVVATIISRAGRLGTPVAAATPVAAITTEIMSGAPAAFGNKKLDLPPGSRLVEIRPDGDRLILRLRQVGGNEQLVVLSLVTGERLGLIDLGAGVATGPSPAVSQTQE
jgi:hypothetical protein